MSEQVAERMARLKGLQDDLTKFGVDADKFQLTIDQITGLTPLIALRETAKAKKSLTNAFGRLKIDELINQTEIIKLEADAITQIRRSLDDLLPEELPEAELSDAVNQFKTGAAALVEDRYVMIREDIKSIKGLVANLVSKQRSVPALLRGDVDDDKTFTKLSEIESKLTRALGDLDARVKKQNERLVPSLDTARTQAEEVAEGVEEAAEATRRVLKHNFRTEKPDEPLARLAQLADDFL